MIGQKLLLNHMEKGDLHIQKNLVEFQDLKRHIQDLDILFLMMDYQLDILRVRDNQSGMDR